MPDPYTTLAGRLDDLTAELRRLDLWSSRPPGPDALASTAPFCHDTLPFHGWLQWVFIPRVRSLIAARAPLPSDCNIAPMAEVSYAEAAWDATELVDLLRSIDQLFAATPGRLQ